MAGICSKALIVLVAALVLAASASAAAPSVAAMNLQAADVPGAKITSQRAIKESGFLSAYVRSFAFKSPQTGLVSLASETALAASPSKAGISIAAFETAFRSSAGRKAIVARISKDVGVKFKAVTLGPVRKVAGYDQGFQVAASVGIKGGRVYETFVFLRLDRVAVRLLEVGVRPISPATTALYATAIAGHIGAELAPDTVSPPTVTGTAQQGQTLTATPGTWTASDAMLGYQWQRCDAAGATCVDVPGATAQTYAVTAADVGTTLRVGVTATTRFGSANASSTQTAVVT